MKIKNRLILREYNSGYNSGMKHDSTDFLCLQNLEKCAVGVHSTEVLVKAYWQGYFDAVHGWVRNQHYTINCQIYPKRFDNRQENDKLLVTV